MCVRGGRVLLGFERVGFGFGLVGVGALERGGILFFIDSAASSKQNHHETTFVHHYNEQQNQ